MTKLKMLRFAFKVFLSILKGNTHIYADDKKTSFLGNGTDIDRYIKDIVNKYNDEVRQIRVVQEAKKILEGQNKNQ